MQIKISARHGHLGNGAQDYIREKAQKLTHLFTRLTMIDVTVDMVNHLHRVEFVVSAEHKHDFVAQESKPDLAAAVDAVVDKLQHQLRRYKEKVQDHRRDPSAGEVAGAPRLEGTSEE